MYQTEVFSVSGMSCAACSAHVEKAVRGVLGVEDVSVSLLTGSMRVSYFAPADAERICEAVIAAGYGAAPMRTEKKAGKTEALSEEREVKRIFARFVASLCFLLPLMYVSMGGLMWNWPLPVFFRENPMAVGLYELLLTAIVMVINQRFFISGFKSFLKGAPNMDTLVAMGSGAAFLYSTAVLFLMSAVEHGVHYLHELYFESAAMILTLITLGKMLEAYSKGKTTNAIKRLMDLSPKTATVLREGKEVTIPADEVVVGELFVVRPGESFPVDGVVVEGESAVNEAALTGESLPVDKGPGAKVSAATLNQNGYLTCRAVRVGDDTTLSQIIGMVEDAASTKAPIAKIADRVSGVFVPAVIAIALVSGGVWALLGKNFSFCLARMISVLVISCPCALGLATPVAIMVGSGVGARSGILFKTAASLESAGKSDIIVLDKTGTVTKGKPAVTDVVPYGNVSVGKLLSVAVSLERKSEHPLAWAIREKAADMVISCGNAENFKNVPGYGISAVIDGQEAFGGNAAYLTEKGVLTDSFRMIGDGLAAEGKTPLYFAQGGELLGLIAVADVLKEDSCEAVREMQDMGLRVVLLTGDNHRTAAAIGKKLAVDAVIADVLPADKEAVVRRLQESGKVAMVGDGINDAPALTRADVGIAVGAGTDIAIDAADVVLMRSSLRDVSGAIRLSRQVILNIKENLFWAFFYNSVGIPLAAGALIPLLGWQMNPMFGAAAMSLSSFCVVTNALRLNFFKPYGKIRSRKAKLDLPGWIRISALQPACPVKRKERNMKKVLKIEGMMCNHCTGRVQKVLEGVEGVALVEMDLEAGTATVSLSADVTDAALMEPVKAAGYNPVDCKTV